jgi:transposase
MKAYSIDLRQRIVAAVEMGEDSQAEVADQYGISLPTVERLLGRWRTTQSVAPLTGKPGRKRTLESWGHWIRAEVQRQPDVTLAELCERLQQTQHLTAHPSMMWRELQRLDLPLKKSRSTTASATRHA